MKQEGVWGLLKAVFDLATCLLAMAIKFSIGWLVFVPTGPTDKYNFSADNTHKQHKGLCVSKREGLLLGLFLWKL